MSLSLVENHCSSIGLPISGFAATATLQQYPMLFLKALKPSVLRSLALEIDLVIRSRIMRTSFACSACFSSLGSHKEASAARISRKLPRLQRSISARIPSISVSPKRWSAIATPSRTRQRESEAAARSIFRASGLPCVRSCPMPTTPHTARNSCCELRGAFLSSNVRKCLNWASVPSSATTLTSSRFAHGPGILTLAAGSGPNQLTFEASYDITRSSPCCVFV